MPFGGRLEGIRGSWRPLAAAALHQALQQLLPHRSAVGERHAKLAKSHAAVEQKLRSTLTPRPMKAQLNCRTFETGPKSEDRDHSGMKTFAQLHVFTVSWSPEEFTDPFSHRLNEGLEGKFYKFSTFHLKSTIFFFFLGVGRGPTVFALRLLRPGTTSASSRTPIRAEQTIRGENRNVTSVFMNPRAGSSKGALLQTPPSARHNG